MPENPGMSRRKLIGLGAVTLAGAALPDALFNLSSAAAAAAGPTEGIGYFARFGVTEKMLRDGLSAALSRGADYADLFFQHRVSQQPRPRGRRREPRLHERRARRRRPRRQGRPDRLRLHRGPHPRGARDGREDGGRDRRRAREARPEGAEGRRRPPGPLPGEDPLGGRAAAAEAAAPLRPQREGPRGRQADPQGERQLRRRGGRDPDRRLERPDRRGPPADDAPRPLLRRRAGREEGDERLQRRRAGRHRLLLARAARPDGEGSRLPDGRPLRRRHPAGRRDARRPRRRGFGDPPPRGDRPRHGGGLQPEGRLHLLRPDRQERRREVREHRRRGNARPPRAARSTSTTRGTRSARRCSSRTAS